MRDRIESLALAVTLLMAAVIIPIGLLRPFDEMDPSVYGMAGLMITGFAVWLPLNLRRTS